MLDLIMLGTHEAELRTLLETEDGTEASAYVLLSVADIGADPWTGAPRQRLVTRAVLPVPMEDRVSASSVHVTWSTRGFVRLLKRAERDGLVPAIVHTHPGSTAFFSDQDDRNERDLLQIVANRAGEGRAFASIVMGGDGTVACRLWQLPDQARQCERVLVTGKHLAVHASESAEGIPDSLDRQARLFGPSFNPAIRALRVGIVGCGGTGSPTAMLLARLGVGHLLFVDDDVVEVTNLNRVHGARRSDAEAAMPKVDVLAREIETADLGVQIARFKGWVGDPRARDALRSCDVLFGCTDDHDGRLFLNRFAYFYGIPVIDMGLRVLPAAADRPYEMGARVTLLAPGTTCLLCRGLVDPRIASEEALRRIDPAEYERRKAEAYVSGGGDPAPAVVTFTTETACMGVNELLQGLTGFRGPGGMKEERRRRFETCVDRANTARPRPECEMCADPGVWGLADVDPFLHRFG
ncbi:ThiF family adenylyltransferase [Methylorubrum thiocyanatum]|uniref:ThiF family adenylyltransferase n=1 Tax=Methylorubrum thiocyanatum TaxID=47958 RepID=UPI00398C2B29